MVLDIYRSKERYEDWKQEVQETGIRGINKVNSDWIFSYVTNMERGENIARGTKKGGRGYKQLNKLRIRMTYLTKLLEARGIKDISKITENQITLLVSDMEKGDIKKRDGTEYKSVSSYVKTFKSFWHWLMKSQAKLYYATKGRRGRGKRGRLIRDISVDLNSNQEENNFVYMAKEEFDKYIPYFTPDEQLRLLFMWDTIIRSPTELMNLKISDFSADYKELTIREETSKTYGRTIKILLCSEGLAKYIQRNNLKDGDYLFKFSPPMFNKKLKKVALQVFGDKMTKGGKRFSEISMYDFRHSGACFWRKGAYKTKIDALMYRGGWSNLRILNYYTKKIGMKDSIERSDLLIEADKTELEKKLKALEKKMEEQNEAEAMRREKLLKQIERLRFVEKALEKLPKELFED